MKLGGIELGGTKIVCAIGNEDGVIEERMIVPTKQADETLDLVFDFFRNKKIDSLGIASFGPVDLNKESETYGFITTTPKPGWEKTDVLGRFVSLSVPLGFDTDVNAACLGEVVHGAARGCKNAVYGTIGTGIGFGIFVNGDLLHGLLHPETGHMHIGKHESDQTFFGPCPYHEDCLETLASGLSIEKRWGKKAYDLYDVKEVWDLESYYLGKALCNCVLCYSPEKIILGGGVMHTPGLIERVRTQTLKQLNGYIKAKKLLECIDEYIVLPELGDDAGVIGAMELGRMELFK